MDYTMDKNYKYYAFISYSRQDEEWAMWLQHELEHYHLPDNLKNHEDLPKEFRPVFRDVDELKAGDIGCTVKLKDVKTGNALNGKDCEWRYDFIKYPNSKYSRAIFVMVSR